MRTRLRPIIRDYSYARSRRYLRVQCEPLGMKFIARFYPNDFDTIAQAREAARQLCDAVEPTLRTAYAETKRDPRSYIGKNGPKKSSSLPAGLGYSPATPPHRYIVVRWQSNGKAHYQRFRLKRGQYPKIIRIARELRGRMINEERERVNLLQEKIAGKLRVAFLGAKKNGAHVIMHFSRSKPRK